MKYTLQKAQNPLFSECSIIYRWYNADMDLNKIVSTNLVDLRKDKGLTQQEFAEAIGFSDKSISKWERGYAIPTVDILIKIADFYGITVNDLIQENALSSLKDKREREGGNSRKVTICVLSASIVWLVATALFINGLIQEYPNMWMAFVYAVPVTFAVLLILMRRFWPQGYSSVINSSLLQWTTVLAVCIQFYLLNQQIWFLLIICIPLQVVTILVHQLRRK